MQIIQSMLDLVGETCFIYHKNVSFYQVDEAKVHILEDFSLEEGLSSASTVTIGQPNLLDKNAPRFPVYGSGVYVFIPG